MSILELFRKRKQSTINENKNTEFSSVELDDETIKSILNQEILEFFPKSGGWKNWCFLKPKEIDLKYLPCHLRDNDWMSELLQQNLVGKKIYISAKKIKEFMDSSKEFEDLRHNYELEIVKWQIKFIKNGGENWIIPKGYDDESFCYVTDAEEFFRGGVVETLTAIGMDREVIEEGLEKNADMWREDYIRLSFKNAFEPQNFYRDAIEPADETHKQNWLKLRRYQYYKKHKASVDKYGEVTPDMQINGEELSQLQNTVKIQDKARKKVIDNWNKNPTYRDTTILGL